MALTQVNSNGLKDDSIVNADVKSDADIAGSKLAADSIAEEKLDISNSASDGQYLQYKDSTDKLTWASVSTTDSTKMPLAGGTFTGDVIFDNATNAGKDLTWDMSDNALEFTDDTKAVFGAGGDLSIFHNGTDSFLDSITGSLKIRSDTGNMAVFTSDGTVELYYNEVKKFETLSSGAKFTGELTVQGGEGESGALNLWADEGDDNADKWRLTAGAGGTINLQNYADGSWENNIQCSGSAGADLYYNNTIRLSTTASGINIPGGQYLQIKHDSGRLTFGADDDMQFYHDGSVGRLYNTTGSYVLRADSFFFQKGDGSEHMARFINDGACELWHDNSKVLETLSYGVQVKRQSGGATGFEVVGPEGQSAEVYLFADDGDDAADKWLIQATAAGNFNIYNNDGNYQERLTMNASGGALKGRWDGVAHCGGVLDMSSGAHLDNAFNCGSVTDIETGVIEIAYSNNLKTNSAIVGFANCIPTSTADQRFGFAEVQGVSTSAFRLSAREVDNDAASMGVADVDNLMFCVWDVD